MQCADTEGLWEILASEITLTSPSATNTLPDGTPWLWLS